jgi:hypothetical protein
MALEFPILLVLFVLVGCVVSLDVTGLTLSKSKYFHDNPDSRATWALSNGLWHAGLLFVYLFVIGFVVEKLVPWIARHTIWLLELLSSILPFIDEKYLQALRQVMASVTKHSPILLGLVAILVVWLTYSEKIKSRPSTGALSELKSLARSAYNLLEIGSRILGRKAESEAARVRFLYWQAQAALVAVDMLALAILIKSLHVIPEGDSLLATLLIITVFACVYFFASTSAIVGSRDYASIALETSAGNSALLARNWLLITLRLVEPLLIFYFALQLVAFLVFGKQIHSTTFMFAATLLVAALIKRHSLSDIVIAATTEPPRTDEINLEQRPVLSILGELRNDAGTLLLWIIGSVLAILLFALFIALRFEQIPTIFPFEAEVSRLSAWIGYFLLIAFLPSPSLLGRVGSLLRPIETRLVSLSKTLMSNCYTFALIFLAVFAATVFPVYDDLLERATRSGVEVLELRWHELGFVENHFHALQIGIWLLWLTLISFTIVIIDKSYPVEERDLSAPTSDRGHFWRWFYAAVYGVAALSLEKVVVPLQENLDRVIEAFRAAKGLAG